MGIINNKYKELENLFSWSEFYLNSKNLNKQTLLNEKMFNKTQKEILKLKKDLNL